MFTDRSAMNTTPVLFNPRRRHQPRSDLFSQRSGPAFSAIGETDAGLDLSMHHSHRSHNNRFASLATPPPSVPRDRGGYHASKHNRRSRNSRRTREARKRRDAKRDRRNFAAQMLDEQLSRNIDQALELADIHPPPAITAVSEPWKPDLTFNWQSWAQIPPTPPQLPVLDFGNLDLDHFALPAAVKQRLPSTPPIVTPSVPIWCPYIPSLMHNGGWNGHAPRFTDLSSVPERKETTKNDSLIRWPGPKDRQPRKQSRFFPSLTTSVSTPPSVVKLPPVRCGLHASEQGLPDPLVTSWSDKYAREVVPCLKPRKREPEVGEDTQVILPTANDHSQQSVLPDLNSTKLASAANLWRILSEDGWFANARLREDNGQVHHRTLSWNGSEASGGVPVGEDPSQPRELESAPRPYLHLNSITVHANEVEQYATTTTTNNNQTASALYLAEFFAAPRAGTPVCELPATPYLYTPSSPMLHALMSGEYVTNEEHGVLTSDALGKTAKSDTHFATEQDLFKPEDKMLPPSRVESPINRATIVLMEHDEGCPCGDCSESPVLTGQKELLEDGSDSWLDWSTIADENEETFVASAPQPTTVVKKLDEDERDVTLRACANDCEWDDFDSHTSERRSGVDNKIVEDLVDENDDGAAFAWETDFEWV